MLKSFLSIATSWKEDSAGQDAEVEAPITENLQREGKEPTLNSFEQEGAHRRSAFLFGAWKSGTACGEVMEPAACGQSGETALRSPSTFLCVCTIALHSRFPDRPWRLLQTASPRALAWHSRRMGAATVTIACVVATFHTLRPLQVACCRGAAERCKRGV